MSIFRRSRDVDVADRCNYWTVGFFLVISTITWFIPINQNPSTSVPEYAATCWCPAEFTESHVVYTNAYCANEFNKQHRVDESDKLYSRSSDNRDSNEAEQSKLGSTVNVPFLLFVFAIVLTLPYIFRSMFSGCTLNFDQTIECAVQVNALDHNYQKSAIQDLVRCTSKDLKAKPRYGSLVYLMVKLLVCVLVVTGIAGVSLLSNIITNDGEGQTRLIQTTENNDSQPSFVDTQMCEIALLNFGNIDEYTIQCLFTLKEQSQTNGYTYDCDSIFCALLLYLGVLFVVNIVSLAMWFFRLVLKSCVKPFVLAPQNSALDLQFLLLMSHENAGPLVTSALSQGFSEPSGAASSEQVKELEE